MNYDKDEKINWLALGTTIMSAFFLVIGLICAIQIDNFIFELAFVITFVGQIMALIYTIRGSTKENKRYYDYFMICYCLANLCFTIVFTYSHAIGTVCSAISAILLIVLVVFKNIKEDRTVHIAIIIAILQLLNMIFLITNKFEIASKFDFGVGFLKAGTYASPLVMSMVQIQMIRSKYIDKKSRGSD